jgi:hypothetical protein
MLPSLIAGLVLAAPLPQPDEVPPNSPPPQFTVVRMEKEGQLTQRVYVPVATEKERERTVIVDGRPVTIREKYTVLGQQPVLRTMEAKGLQAFDTTGKAVARDRLRELLRKDTLVLLASDGNKPAPAYLRAVKEGTLILVLPSPAEAPLVPVLPALPVPREELKRPK